MAFDPFKVTDPNDPRFNPDKFSFADYNQMDSPELRKALKKTFPLGTPKKYVNKVLVQGDGAEYHVNKNYENEQIVRYAYTQFLRAHITVVFDESDKLLNIHVSSADKLYKDQPGLEEILGWNKNKGKINKKPTYNFDSTSSHIRNK